MGLYDKEYTITNEYRNLHSFPPLGEPQDHCWRRISTSSKIFTPSISKSSSFKSPALVFVHTLLNGTVIGSGDSTGVISRHEFHYLLSMVDNVPYHMGFVIAVALHHQAIDPRASAILQVPTLLNSFPGWVYWVVLINWLSWVDSNPLIYEVYKRCVFPCP